MKLLKALGAAVGATAMVAALTPAAHAAGQDSIIENGEFVFWYSLGCPSSSGISDFANSKSDLAGYTFLGAGSWAGVGQPVKNRSRCVRNLKTVSARVYYNSGWVGVNDFIPGNTTMNLTNTRTENASFRWTNEGG